jgi:hypothetical protein
MNLDDVVPRPQFAIVQSRAVNAPIDLVWDQLLRVTMSDLPVGWFLTQARRLPSRLTGHKRKPLGPQTFLDETPIPVLSSNPPTSVLSAGLSRAWQLVDTATPPRLDPLELRTWSQPSWIKVGMEFRLEAGPTGTLITCETRIVATDTRTKRIFGAYWFLIRTGSIAIRLEVLRVVARHAESLPPTP